MDGMDKNKTFLIVGLGLLGGKYAQVLSQKGYRVTGITHSQSTLDYALEHAYICEGRNENFDDLVQNADYIIFGLYPTVLLEWVKQYGHLVRPGTLITDVSGVKRGVVEPVQQMLPEGVEFIASHPMAGREFSGFEYSLDDLFDNASFIMTPTENTPQEEINLIEDLARSIHFKKVVKTTPEEHDRIIAFTSQLAHVVSNAYIKSPTHQQQLGFSAGSFQDLTRVAKLNEDMWTPLFIMNKEPLCFEIDYIMARLAEYRDAIANEDHDRLRQLLRDGRILKETTPVD